MAIGACITMGLIQLRVGRCRKPGAANLLFAFNAFVMAVYASFELALTRADSPASYLAALRWMDIIGGGVLVSSLAAFVWAFFGTGRRWLAWLAPCLLVISLIPDLLPVPKLVFLHINEVKTVHTFGGGTYPVAEGVRNSWNGVFYLGVLMLLVFVVDASVTLWRRGARYRAAVVGGSITFFILFSGVHSALVDAGIVRTPYFFSFAYLAILVAMGLELSHDVLKAAQLASNLRESEQRMAMATDAANLGIWIRDLVRNEIWATDKWRAMFGFEKSERIDLNAYLQKLHPADRDAVSRTMAKAVERDGPYETEYRVVRPDGQLRWIASRGRVEFNGANQAVLVRGTSLDITGRKKAEEEAQNLSGLLIHAQEAERTRLARELHDDLSQSLALLAVELDMLGQRQPAGSAVSERMQEFSARIRNLSSGVHRLSHELHPAKLEQLGLVAAVRGFAGELGAAHQMAVECEFHNVPRGLPDDIALCFYRIVQEGLQNVVKHSGAVGAKVILRADEKELCLTISDQGSGFDPAATTGNSSLGLVGMRERVRLVHGKISIQSSTGEGTRIEVRVPLPPAQTGESGQ
jgi:PAS domain S-box-containing protein